MIEMPMFVAADGRSRNLARLGVKIEEYETENNRKDGGKNLAVSKH